MSEKLKKKKEIENTAVLLLPFSGADGFLFLPSRPRFGRDAAWVVMDSDAPAS